jgi:hypothetical protein
VQISDVDSGLDTKFFNSSLGFGNAQHLVGSKNSAYGVRDLLD